MTEAARHQTIPMLSIQSDVDIGFAPQRFLRAFGAACTTKRWRCLSSFNAGKDQNQTNGHVTWQSRVAMVSTASWLVSSFSWRMTPSMATPAWRSLSTKGCAWKMPPPVFTWGVDSNGRCVAPGIKPGLPHPFGGLHAHHVRRCQIGPPQVAAIGCRCMNFSTAWQAWLRRRSSRAQRMAWGMLVARQLRESCARIRPQSDWCRGP